MHRDIWPVANASRWAIEGGIRCEHWPSIDAIQPGRSPLSRFEAAERRSSGLDSIDRGPMLAAYASFDRPAACVCDRPDVPMHACSCPTMYV